ncbi:MAG: SPFH domain-containing protein [Patescibacteria group bacterium UBA2103]
MWWSTSLWITGGVLLLLIIAFFLSKKGTTLSLAVGVAFSVLIGLLIYGTIIYALRLEMFVPSWFAQIAAQVIAAAAGFQVYRFGSVLVPLKHKAVITIFEERRDECPTLEEGAAWLFPGFMNAIAVDARKFNIDIPPFFVFTEDLIKVELNLSSILSVECPNKYLNVDAAENMIQQLARRAARACSNDIGVRDIVKQDDKISTAIHEEVQGIVSDWGLKVHYIKAENITPPDEIAMEAQRKVIEEIQREAEEYEAETLQRKISILVDKFEKYGMTPDKAANLIQAESSKITRTAFDLEGIDSVNVLQAVIAFAEALKGKGSKDTAGTEEESAS